MTRRWRHAEKTTDDPNQLRIEWGAAKVEETSASGETAKLPVLNPADFAPPPTTITPPPAKSSSRRRSRKASSHTDRITARLPVPKPRPASVAAGRFGHDDDGRVIRPEADEIRAITEALAERLVELLDAMRALTQDSTRQPMQEQFAQAIRMYALEFGERPAQLEAYVRRQSSLDESERTDQGSQR